MSTKINSLPLVNISSLSLTSPVIVGVGSDGYSYQTTVGSLLGLLSNSPIEEPFYKTGVWTPFMIPQTPGDFSISSYGNQIGYYTRIGHTVWATLRITANVVSYTTASGQIVVGGFPYLPRSGTAANAPVALTGFSWPNSKALNPFMNMTAGSLAANMTVYGNSITQFAVTMTHMDGGNVKVVRTVIQYETDDAP